jgi:hypothetical protein
LLAVLVAKSAVMQWPFINFEHGTKPEEKGVCDTQNNRAERLSLAAMSMSFMPSTWPTSHGENVQNPGQNEWPGCGSKKWKVGMTPTPPANASPGGNGGVPGDETSAIPARVNGHGGAQNGERL